MRRTVLLFISVIAAVVALSAASRILWPTRSEYAGEQIRVLVTPETSVRQIVETYSLKPDLLRRSHLLDDASDLDRSIAAAGLTVAEAELKVRQALVLRAQEESKNWGRILAKFVLWLAFLAFAFVLMRRGAISAACRRMMFAFAVLVFGIVLGSDPSPMGTVKDAIVLYGRERVIFPPRLVAFAVFVAMTIVANKYICSWGCQLGVLQDLVFRLNRDTADRRGILRQWKPPFFLSNGIRLMFLAAFVIAAFASGSDIIAPVDPFAVFNPAVLTVAGAVFTGVVLVLSLFTYRPWCHFLCPFGFVGWIGEKVSLYKIKVNYSTCIACGACAKACPSTVMGAILKHDKRTIPDCFACGTCIGVCPTKSVSFAAGKRTLPPEGKFDPH